MREEYKMLLIEYPEVVSKEQLCQICHISKRKAAWLLENGLIPCSDTGKKTKALCARNSGGGKTEERAVCCLKF